MYQLQITRPGGSTWYGNKVDVTAENLAKLRTLLESWGSLSCFYLELRNSEGVAYFCKEQQKQTIPILVKLDE